MTLIGQEVLTFPDTNAHSPVGFYFIGLEWGQES